MRHLPRLLAAAALGTCTLVAVDVADPAPARAADNQCNATKTVYVKNPQARVNLDELGFREAWRLATGRGQVVAVVDSGIDARNAHLRDAVEAGRSFVGGAPTDDAQAHGTAIAGIIAARKLGNGSVLVGGAPAAELLPVRVLVRGDDTSTSNVAKGIAYAADRGADVINVSISTGASDPSLPALKAAVKRAVARGAVVVAPAGNRAEKESYTQVQYPAGFPGVVGVAATNQYGVVDDYTIHGPHVDVAAPGSGVLTTFRDKGDCLVGLDRPYSSYATAYVSAVAAQLRERFPDDTAAQTINRLTSSADRPRRHERDDREGWGTIQPVAALSTDSSAGPEVVADTEQRSAGRSIIPAGATTDPLTPARDHLLWWGLAMTALLAVALVARPLTRSRRR